MNVDLASDPTVLTAFDAVCRLVTAASNGSITLRELGAAHALARALVRGDRDRAEDLARELRIDPEALQ